MFEGESIIKQECPHIEYSEAFKLCINTFRSPTSEGCFGNEFYLWDRKLNAKYKDLLKSLSDKADNDFIKNYHAIEKEHLLDSQRQWIKFRDTNCEFMKDEPTGIPDVSNTQCILEMTVQRTIELDRMLPQDWISKGQL